MEGFWTVQFTGLPGAWGNGVVTLIAGQVFGGDGAFLYARTYTDAQNQLTANIHVRRYAQGVPSVMGQDQFDLALTGASSGDVIGVTGSIPGTALRFQGTLTKRGKLPR
jgi:hypothetical protein